VTFAAIGAAMAALGVLSVTGVTRRDVALGIFLLVTAGAGFGIAGYYFWARHWLASRPGKLRQAEQEMVVHARLHRRPDEPTV
jgi:hypothetical protein